MDLKLEEVYGKLKTTVIGSFPLPHSYENMARSLKDQVEVGIDYPCYGQLLDMNMMFLKPLSEKSSWIEVRGDEAWLVGEPKPPFEAVCLEYLDFALRYLSEKSLLKKVSGVKVPVTGPITLSCVIKVTERHRAIDYPDVVLALSNVVASIVRGYDEAGAKIITIDEPTLPCVVNVYLSRDEALEALNKVSRAFSRAVPSIHCCGDVGSIVEIMLNSSFAILSHAFKTNLRNFEAYSRKDLEAYDKVIGLGCIDSSLDPASLIEVASSRRPWATVVESVDEVESLIHKAGEAYGYERLFIHPDCGFGGLRSYFKNDLGYLIAIAKLKVMVEATKEVRKKVGLSSS